MRIDPVEWLSGQKRGFFAGCLRTMLWSAQFPYSVAIAWRNRRYDRGHGVTRVDVPVISLGNLTTGGTGKTPAVVWVCRQLRELGIRVSTVSRGYGADEKTGLNDEAIELERQLPDVPHLQNPDRIAAAQMASEELAAQCIVLDDGFQHRRLARDLDWVLIDARVPFGFGHLLPRGLLREPLASLKRADAVIISRADQVTAEELAALRLKLQAAVRPQVPIIAAAHRPVAWVDSQGHRVVLDELNSMVSERRGENGPTESIAAFCGIGNPEAFRQTLVAMGHQPVAWRVFPDHHRYDRGDLESLAAWVAQAKVKSLVCTVKDLVKLETSRIGGVRLWALEVGMQFIDDPAPLQNALAELASRIETQMP